MPKITFLERSHYGHIVKTDSFTEKKIAHYKISKVCKLAAIYGLFLHGGREVCLHPTEAEGKRQLLYQSQRPHLPPSAEQAVSC